MKRIVVLFTLALVLLMAFSLLIYPTPYKYIEYVRGSGVTLPLKENRFTGEVLIYNPVEGVWVEKLN